MMHLTRTPENFHPSIKTCLHASRHRANSVYNTEQQGLQGWPVWWHHISALIRNYFAQSYENKLRIMHLDRVTKFLFDFFFALWY